MGATQAINVFGFIDSPAEETDGCGQPSCGQEGTQRKSLHLEPLNKTSLMTVELLSRERQLITSASHVFQIYTMCYRLTATFSLFTASQK